MRAAPSDALIASDCQKVKQNRHIAAGYYNTSGGAKLSQQCSRVLYRMLVDVVVEIRPGRAPLLNLAAKPLGPGGHLVLRVAAPIFSAGAMEADVSGSPARPLRRDEAAQIVGYEPGAVAIKQGQDIFRIPARVPELDDMFEVARQALKEGSKPW